jgi:hypothetical protein
VRGRECTGGVLREEKGCACEEDGGNARLGTRKAKKGKGEWGQLDTRPSGEKKGVGGGPDRRAAPGVCGGAGRGRAVIGAHKTSILYTNMSSKCIK